MINLDNTVKSIQPEVGEPTLFGSVFGPKLEVMANDYLKQVDGYLIAKRNKSFWLFCREKNIKRNLKSYMAYLSYKKENRPYRVQWDLNNQAIKGANTLNYSYTNMIYTCDRCGKEFETPIMVDSGGEYGGTPHKEPASPCCEGDYIEFVE